MYPRYQFLIPHLTILLFIRTRSKGQGPCLKNFENLKGLTVFTQNNKYYSGKASVESKTINPLFHR